MRVAVLGQVLSFDLSKCKILDYESNNEVEFLWEADPPEDLIVGDEGLFSGRKLGNNFVMRLVKSAKLMKSMDKDTIISMAAMYNYEVLPSQVFAEEFEKK